MQKRSKFQIRSDAAKQRWVRDDRKESFWRKHIEAWKKSGLSKRAYCLSNDLSDSSFNAWNREISIRDREKVPTANAAELLSPEDKNPFVPLRLLADERAVEKPDSQAQVVKSLDLEILVPGGAVIRINERSSISFVVELFSSLKS
ncbi:MAG: hypothetical protein IT342_20945 [Candidatus Melainabacteria bacterium]|nr:hypothetical protein [Candidatus Melainabacteria bacterium]